MTKKIEYDIVGNDVKETRFFIETLTTVLFN